jgi:hypothetical protein
MNDLIINFNIILHPDLEAIARRDAFLSDENGKKLNQHMRSLWPDIDDDNEEWQVVEDNSPWIETDWD